ncbi:MAG: endonuclease/exonuclease/phosphatase family protein [Phycisphaerales bacterium]|nr:endonuclease/exonuclease/phosphatase family protein [Planctomycetota bacterium]MCH8508798.1 endonuclease/exonuclease/phosphatase family protein [Phycisphaerales bacterium]
MTILAMIPLLLLMMFTPIALASGDADDGMHLKLMSYNIRFGTANDGPNHWDLRRDIALDVIERWDSDIIGLQEPLRFQLDEIRERFPHYGEIGVARDDGRITGEYSSILYRLDRFAVAEAGTFWLSHTPDKVASITWGNSITRICTWARLVEHETGRGVYVYNTHFDHVSQPSREKSVRLIAEHIAARSINDPVVFMGDINVPENNPVMEFVFSTADGMGMVDTFRVIHPDEPLAGTFHAFRGRRDNRKIDYILVDPQARVLDAAIDHSNVDGRYPSDHYPITATVILPPAAD